MVYQDVSNKDEVESLVVNRGDRMQKREQVITKVENDYNPFQIYIERYLRQKVVAGKKCKNYC